MKDFPNAEIWNYIVNPSLVAAGGPTPIYTTSYWSSTEAYYSPNNAYAIHFPDATLEKYLREEYSRLSEEKDRLYAKYGSLKKRMRGQEQDKALYLP